MDNEADDPAIKEVGREKNMNDDDINNSIDIQPKRKVQMKLYIA